VTGEVLGQIASNALALGIALLGWVLHVRTCRQTMGALQEENKRLVEALSRAIDEQSREPRRGEWRRAP
jgi:hypothetical protein